jgi:hypothetical protein
MMSLRRDPRVGGAKLTFPWIKAEDLASVRVGRKREPLNVSGWVWPAESQWVWVDGESKRFSMACWDAAGVRGQEKETAAGFDLLNASRSEVLKGCFYLLTKLATSLRSGLTSRKKYKKYWCRYRDSVTRFLTSGFFHESVSPKHLSITLRAFRIFLKMRGDIRGLKVPKCEIFHLFDFNDFYGIKSV